MLKQHSKLLRLEFRAYHLLCTICMIDNDINGNVRRSVRGIEVNEEELAAEVFEPVGPGGNFLGNMHPMKRARTEFYYARAATRTSFDSWRYGGSKDTWAQAEDVARKILSEHATKEIPGETLQSIFEKETGIVRI